MTPTANAGSGCYALAADRVFDGKCVLSRHAVVVNGSHIGDVLPRDALPNGIPVAYTPDTTLLPGLIDAHVHFMRWQAPLYPAWGVTTVRDVGNALGWILARRTAASTESGPDLVCLGPLVDGPRATHPWVSRACRAELDAHAAIRDLAYAGVDGVKFYVGLPPEWLRGMASECHAHGLRVCMHSQGVGVRPLLAAGVDECFHLDGVLVDVWPTRPTGWLSLWGHPGFATTRDARERLADDMATAGIAVTPTLAYWHSQVRLRSPDYDTDADSLRVPPDMVRWQRRMSADVEAMRTWGKALEAAINFTGRLLHRGVRVFAGTDVPCGALAPGLSLWRELALLQAAGMAPVRALQAATRDVADFLGLPDRGRLQPGARADLVVVRQDPTHHIPIVPSIVTVVQRGQVLEPAALLDQAAPLAGTTGEDPWGLQFRQHAGEG